MGSKRKTRLTTIILKRKTKNKENYKNKNYKKFTTILISFSTWISKKKKFFLLLFLKINFICSLFFPPFFYPKMQVRIFFSKKFFFFNSPKIFAIINVRANENIPFLIFITKVFQNLQKMMISVKLGFFDTLASAKFIMQKKNTYPF